MNHFPRYIAGAAAWLAIGGTAHAIPLTASQIFSQFNAVISGNFSSSSEVEGRVVVGGNVTSGSSNQFDFNPNGAAASSFPALTVYGSVTSGSGTTLTADNGGGITIAGSNSAGLSLKSGGGGTYDSGSLYIGGGNGSGTISADTSASLAINGNSAGNLNLNGTGTMVLLNGNNSGNIGLTGSTSSIAYVSSSGNINANSGATKKQENPVPLPTPITTSMPFAATFQDIIPLSTNLAAQKSNSTATFSSGTITFNSFNGTQTPGGTAVFNIDASVLTNPSANTVSLALNGAASVIINVTCAIACPDLTLASGLHFNNLAGDEGKLLWNFPSVTKTLTFPTLFAGSILAPYATVSNSTPIDGTLVAAGYTGTGEIHSYPFSGPLPDPAVVSEPASVALVGMGLVGLGAVRRRAIRRNPRS